jgi:hypothetical protein
MKASNLDRKQLTEALLRAVRDEDWNRQAAVRIVIEHGYWLGRRSFLAYVDAYQERGEQVAWVEFGGLADVVDGSGASSSERAVLRLACHLAGAMPTRPRDPDLWSPAAILRPLGRASSRLAVNAVRYAATGRWP